MNSQSKWFQLNVSRAKRETLKRKRKRWRSRSNETARERERYKSRRKTVHFSNGNVNKSCNGWSCIRRQRTFPIHLSVSLSLCIFSLSLSLIFPITYSCAALSTCLIQRSVKRFLCHSAQLFFSRVIGWVREAKGGGNSLTYNSSSWQSTSWCNFDFYPSLRSLYCHLPGGERAVERYFTRLKWRKTVNRRRGDSHCCYLVYTRQRTGDSLVLDTNTLAQV